MNTLIIPCESFFKAYHYKKQYILEKIYLGVVSNPS